MRRQRRRRAKAKEREREAKEEARVLKVVGVAAVRVGSTTVPSTR